MKAARQKDGTFRVIISTDLGELPNDQDDIQSLIHLLHYTDILKIEGLISSPRQHRPDSSAVIKEWVKRADLDYLRKKGHHGLMSEEEVLATVKQGELQPHAPKDGGGNAGTRHLIEMARKQSDACLWVLAWGPLTDIAQALHDAPDIADNIRLYSIGGSNTHIDPQSRIFIYQHMADRWKNLWWIENGMLPGNFKLPPFMGYWYDEKPDEPQYGSAGYLNRVIRPRGTTRNGTFSQTLGQAFPVAFQRKLKHENILKEGDSPSFIYLLSSVVGGVGDPDNPENESWGGRWYRPFPKSFPGYYTDLDDEPEVYINEIRKWRPAFLADWEKRWLWYD